MLYYCVKLTTLNTWTINYSSIADGDLVFFSFVFAKRKQNHRGKGFTLVGMYKYMNETKLKKRVTEIIKSPRYYYLLYFVFN